MTVALEIIEVICYFLNNNSSVIHSSVTSESLSGLEEKRDYRPRMLCRRYSKGCDGGDKAVACCVTSLKDRKSCHC